MGDEASQKFGGNWHREGILSRSKTKRYFLFVIQKFSLVRDRLCTPYLHHHSIQLNHGSLGP